MKYILITLLTFLTAVSYASGAETTLKDLRNQIIEKEMQESENKLNYKPLEEIEIQKQDKRLSVTFSRKSCMEQGNTFDECELLRKKAASYLEGYDFTKPDVPNFDQVREDLFITIRIKQ